MRVHSHGNRRRGLTSLAIALPVALVAVGCTASSEVTEPPALESRVKDMIEVDGQSFKDLNANGELDVYEDWRETVENRTANLVEQMTLEEKAGLMLIDTLNAECDAETGQFGTVPELADEFVGEQQMHRFIFRNVVAAGDREECAPGEGGFSTNVVVTPAEAAEFMNAVQEKSEATRLGIPVLYKSNARNHIDPQARAGINESAGAFSPFPKEAGIAAAALGEQAASTGEATDGDMSVVDEFASTMGEEWSSIGLRGMYGYMADLSTEPRWYRTHETFTEDADLGANIMSQLVESLQGEVDGNGVSLSPESDVALTMKHFPGGGPQELGLDPHYSFGKAQVYPGDAFGYHLKPFEAAIAAGVSSIMPYYGVPVDVTYEGVDYDEVGMAFSDQIVNGLLRDEMGFQGYVNSDTGIINDRAWGLEDATVPERVAAAINGGAPARPDVRDGAVREPVCRPRGRDRDRRQ
jgi:beta-glucosidase